MEEMVRGSKWGQLRRGRWLQCVMRHEAPETTFYIPDMVGVCVFYFKSL